MNFHHFVKNISAKVFSLVAMLALLSSSLAPLFAFPATAAAFGVVATPAVVINEFVSDPSSGGNEWVELYNTTGGSVDLTGWHLEDASAHALSLSGSMPAHGFVVFEFTGSVLNNGGDSIKLLDDASSQIDLVEYGTSGGVPAPGVDQSAYRTTDGGSSWDVTSSPTKDISNVVAPPAGTFSAAQKYIRTHHAGDLAAVALVPSAATAARFTYTQTDGSNVYTAVAGTEHLQSGQFPVPSTGQHQYRGYVDAEAGTYSVTGEFEIAGTWYPISGSATVYVLNAPAGSFVIPSAGSNTFRPGDNPVRVSAADANDTFKSVSFKIDGTTYTVNRAQCDVREAGNRVLCDVSSASNWGANLPEGTYTATAMLYNLANSHTTLTSDSFTIDATRPVLSNFVLDPAAPPYDASVTASAEATDASGIKDVRFSVTVPRASDGVCTGNGTALESATVTATSTGNTYTSALDLRTLTNGDYCVNAVAGDVAANHSAPQSLKITVAHPVDTTRPTLVFNVPRAGTFATSTLPVSVTATDSESGLANLIVHLYSGSGALLGSCGSGESALAGASTDTYTCTVDTGALGDGAYTLKAGTFDVAGNNRTVSMPFSVDNTRPNATITAPADASTQTGAFTITGTATDTLSGIDHVNVYVSKVTPPDSHGKTFGGYVVNNQPAVWNAGAGTFSYDVSGLADGAYLVKAVAFDKAGNSHFASPAPAIAVVNAVPNLAITAPALDGDTVSGTYAFTAEYDNGVTNSFSWAVRSGATCSNSSGTVFGNVDGHHDSGSLSGTTFSTASVDTSTWSDGQYCFVVNDLHGHRPTRIFTVDNTPVPTASVTTDAASGLTSSAATLNGTNGALDAENAAFWWGTTATSSFTAAVNPGSELPSGWSNEYASVPLANAAFSHAVSGLTASTTYYYVAWVKVAGTWYPGAVQSFTTASDITLVANSVIVKMADLAANFSDAVLHPSKWFFWDDNTDSINNTLGSFVAGPDTAPLHDGSAQIAATAGDRIALASGALAGTALKDITSLSYATYRSVGTSALDLALQFDINTAGTTTPSSYQGRLVYEPYFTNTVADNTWQTWNPMTGANWWFSRAGSSVSTTCTQSAPCTWSEILAAFPDIGITNGTYFKAGQWVTSNFTGNIDDFVVGVKNGSTVTTTTYDFEPTEIVPVAASVSLGGGAESVVGDLNHDGKVDILDLALMMAAFGHYSENTTADLNGDHAVDAADLAILFGNWTSR